MVKDYVSEHYKAAFLSAFSKRKEHTYESLARYTRIPRSTVVFYVGRFAEEGLLETRKDGKKIVVSVKEMNNHV